MSFDLGVLDFDDKPTSDEVEQRYELLCDGADDGQAPSERIDAMLAECIRRWPGETDEEFDESPWSSWPLENQRTAAGLVVNIRWGAAEEMRSQWQEMAERHGLVLYDPQEGDVVFPSRLVPPGPGKRGWFGRRRK